MVNSILLARFFYGFLYFLVNVYFDEFSVFGVSSTIIRSGGRRRANCDSTRIRRTRTGSGSLESFGRYFLICAGFLAREANCDLYAIVPFTV